MDAQVEAFVAVPEGFGPVGQPQRVVTQAIVEVERQGYVRVRREVAPGKMLTHRDAVLRFRGLPEGTKAFESGAPSPRPTTVTTGLEVVGGKVCRISGAKREPMTPAELWSELANAAESSEATADDVATFLRSEPAAEMMRSAAAALVRQHVEGMSARERLTWLRQLANGPTVKGYVAADLPGGLEVFLEVLAADTKPERLPVAVEKITSEG